MTESVNTIQYYQVENETTSKQLEDFMEEVAKKYQNQIEDIDRKFASQQKPPFYFSLIPLANFNIVDEVRLVDCN